MYVAEGTAVLVLAPPPPTPPCPSPSLLPCLCVNTRPPAFVSIPMSLCINLNLVLLVTQLH